MIGFRLDRHMTSVDPAGRSSHGMAGNDSVCDIRIAFLRTGSTGDVMRALTPLFRRSRPRSRLPRYASPGLPSSGSRHATLGALPIVPTEKQRVRACFG